MPKLYFTREDNRVHVQSNPELCKGQKKSVDFYLDADEEYAGLSYAILWDAGAGEIIMECDGRGKITRISQDQDDKIYSWSQVSDEPLWYHLFENEPCAMMPFYEDYDTSLKKYYDR